MTMGGSTAGSFKAVDFQATSGDELASERKFNWLTGSLMTFEITNADPFWAKTEWEANRLLFNGQSMTNLSNLSWLDATDPAIGLGSGHYWNYSNNTLALGFAAVPEPTGALAGLLLGLGLLHRRRHRP